MRYNYKILIIGLIIGSFACNPKVKIKDEEGNTIELEVSSIEFTTNEKEEQKKNLILKEINAFLENNKSDAVKNYLFLCDSSMIKSLRKYKAFHKEENIYIGLGKDEVQLSPIPGTYKISEGPFAEYKLINDSIELISYFIDIKLDEEFKVTDYKATLRFCKRKDGEEKRFFKKEINPNDKYLIEEKIKNNKW